MKTTNNTNGKVIKFKDNSFDFLVPSSNGYTLDRIKFSKWFLNIYNVYTVERDSYVYIKGVYSKVSDYILKSLIEKEFEKKGISKGYWVKESLEKIKLDTAITFVDFNNMFDINPNLINVKNGMIEIKDNEILFYEHNPKFLTTIQLNVNYNKNAKIKEFKYFLESSLNTDEERLLLQEHLGYHFFNNLPGHYFYCFHGTGGNGKGVYFKLMREILGFSNVAMERSSMLSETSKQNQFYGNKFNGKLSIQVPETAYYLNNMDLIKAFSGGDRQDIELKYSNHSNQFDFKGKLSIATNDKIKIRIDDGVERRITFIKMNNKPKKVINNLFEIMVNEIEGIFNWGLDGLLRFKLNNFKHTLPESHYKLFNAYWVHSDNYLRFVRSFIKSGKGVSKSELVQKFIEEFSNMHKNKMDIKDKLEEALKNEGYKFHIKKDRVQSLIDGSIKNTPAYIGIEYIEHKEEEENINDEVIINNVKIDKQMILDYIKEIKDISLIEELKQELFSKENSMKCNMEDLHNIVKENINDGFELIEDTKKLEEIKKIPPQSTNCADVFYLDSNNCRLVKTNNYNDKNKIYVQNNKIIIPDVDTLTKMDISSNYLKYQLKPGMSLDKAKNILNTTF
jgi:P4 family phage/plasmid primase-like protien